jgi:hypothetical protein
MMGKLFMNKPMAQQLKRWESPRRQGRNHKGKGGSARQRQLQKRLQNLRHQLTQNDRGSNHSLFLCCAYARSM